LPVPPKSQLHRAAKATMADALAAFALLGTWCQSCSRRMKISLLGLIAGFAVVRTIAAPAEAPPADFQEIQSLLREHLIEFNEAELERAAVRGVLHEFKGRVALRGTVATQPAEAPGVSYLDGNVARFRIMHVQEGLAAGLEELFKAVQSTNALKGLVLDLRFASGEDYDSAVKATKLFLSKETPLLDWGKGMVTSSAGTALINVPLVVLINNQTRSAAEALAGMLRQANAALLLGEATAGAAYAFDEFSLRNGQVLLIASGKVKLGDGEEIPESGIKADIQIETPAGKEREFYDEPIAPEPVAGTVNTRSQRRPRISEADLVRERLEDTNIADIVQARQSETERPVMRDPVLARAVDLLKGLAVMRGAR